MSCHPSHGKTGHDDRSIHRMHRFPLGQHPQDPDADPDSGWIYYDLEVVEGGPTEPNQRHLLEGGPESGLPCQSTVGCKGMTRVAGSWSQARILQQPEVRVTNSLNDKDWKRLESETVVALVCPKCEAVHQVDGNMLSVLKRHLSG